MAPSLFKKLGAAFVIASAGKVLATSYTLTDEYTADNFFDKFDFYVTAIDGADPTEGYVNYRSQADAESLGLISSSDGKIYIGPDTNQTYSSTGSGRDSVRVMSKAKYNQGLMIAKFSHMPVQSCGSWPAFWSYGSPWLSSGEIDYYEGWNDLGSNVMALHTNKTIAGQCLLTTTGVAAEVTTQDCDDRKEDTSINQYVGTGCGVADTTGVWSSTTGATFAMQWTDQHIKVWNWLPSNVPADITAGSPDPDANSDSWGLPQLLVEENNCDLNSAFSDQQLVFNIDFCGLTAGNSVLWGETCSAMGNSCVDYVASTPEAFAETYFEIEKIQFYELGAASSSVSASASVSAASSGLLAGTGSVVAPSLGVSATTDLTVPAAALTVPAAATSTHSHTTSYITGTSTTVNEQGETTVVVVVDTTICPVTASEASESSVLAAASTPVPAETTATFETSVIATTPATSETSAIVTTPAAASSTYSHTTSYITSTSTTVNVKGETTVVVVVDSTICPVTASEASKSSALALTSTPVPAQTTTPAASVPAVASTTLSTTVIDKESTLTSTQMTTSTIFATHTSTIASCVPGASGCTVGDVTTVVVALSTTICPVTAAEASQGANATTVVGSASSASAVTQSQTVIVTPSSAVPLAAESSPPFNATSKTAAAYTSVPLAAQSTGGPRPTTVSRVTKSLAGSSTVLATQTSETVLEMATGTPTAGYGSVTYSDATETLVVASATYSYPGGNGTTMGIVTATDSGAASPTSTCEGIDCIVVSNSGSKSTVGASGIVLAAIAGAVFLL
jgi:hypothetical protein